LSSEIAKDGLPFEQTVLAQPVNTIIQNLRGQDDLQGWMLSSLPMFKERPEAEGNISHYREGCVRDLRLFDEWYLKTFGN
jgi:hypothetical protein